MDQNAFSKNIVRIVCLGMFASQLISYKLWTAHPGFPSTPVAGLFGGWPAEIQLGLFWVSLLLMLFTVFRPNKTVVAGLLFLQLIICMADQNRWQPWQYQYLFMLAAFVFTRDENRRLWGWQMILISTYFFSALWKFQPAFIHDVWLGYILRGWLHIYDIPSWAFRAGYILPLFEMGAALLLCFARTRRVGIWTLTGMHGMILLMMSPLGMDNYVLWPWNISMIALGLLLFNRHAVIWTKEQLKPVFNIVIFICWALLPWLNKAGLWDRYFSSVLFSGGLHIFFISTTHPGALKAMKPYIRNNYRLPNQQAISTYLWGSAEMNSIPIPEKRNFKHIAREWMKTYQDSSARFFVIKTGFQPNYEEITKEELAK